ncbi:hypothetical protein SAMN05216238_11334 [Lentibacillus persicus]|uniref:Uncharacterized protein n=1 Tax=Lentibacillus persicus TaxID=640948 RepID=A0A1I1ZUB2_9BACI|nr:hypothetical protein [Lentibacillus persicus]SFE34120.1 hypothetical protein SAMN05216238_11334 [Lentibacillus persicus]
MLKTITIDVSDSVFESEMPASMYITKEELNDTDEYIVSIPSVNFSCYISGVDDYKALLELNIFAFPHYRENLVKVIRSNINLLID